MISKRKAIEVTRDRLRSLASLLISIHDKAHGKHVFDPIKMRRCNEDF